MEDFAKELEQLLNKYQVSLPNLKLIDCQQQVVSVQIVDAIPAYGGLDTHGPFIVCKVES
jgi:hypothetical protein